MAHMAATKTTMMVDATEISESQIKGWQSCSLKPCRTLSSDVVVAKVQVGERRALREHRRQQPCPLITEAVVAEVEVGERRALREHRRQLPRSLSSAAWASVTSILVGFEVGHGVGQTLDGARRRCACA